MPRNGGIPGRRGWAAWVALALAASAAWGAVTGWAGADLASPDQHGARAAWLAGLEVGYPLAGAGLPGLGGVAVGALIAGRRRRGPARTARARAALAGAAALLALLGAEAAAGLHLAWAHRVPELAMVRGAPPRTGPGNDQDDPAPPWPVGLARRLGGLSPVCRLVREVRDRELVAARPPGRGGPVVDAPSCTPAQAERLLADFGRRAEAALRDLNRAGVLTVVVVPPGNDADFAPNRSVLPPSLPRAERREFARRVAAARALEAADPARAVAAYRALVARQPGFALTTDCPVQRQPTTRLPGRQ